jgi:myosin heavy subunit
LERIERIRCLEREIPKFEQTIIHLQRRSKVAKAVARTHKVLFAKIAETENALGLDHIQEPSVRSLIRTVVMVKRWVSLVGQPKVYETTARDWAWLNPETGTDVSGAIRGLQAQIETLQQRNEQAKTECASLSATLTETIADRDAATARLGATIEQLHDDLDQKVDRIEQLEVELKKEVQTRNELLSQKIDQSEHEAIVRKYSTVKKCLKQNQIEMTEKDSEIDHLRDELQAIEQRATDESQKSDHSEHEIEELRASIRDQSWELEITREELLERNRQLLALERLLAHQEEAARYQKSQVQSYATEKRRMLTQHRRQVDSWDCRGDCHLGDRLREMSQNLTGTLLR